MYKESDSGVEPCWRHYGCDLCLKARGSHGALSVRETTVVACSIQEPAKKSLLLLDAKAFLEGSFDNLVWTFKAAVGASRKRDIPCDGRGFLDLDSGITPELRAAIRAARRNLPEEDPE